MATMKEMSGERESAPQLKLNQIRINGQTGEFLFKDILHPKEVDGRNTFEEHSLGKEVKVVFLKVRRKLVQFRTGKKPIMSQEHNSKYDKITLFGDSILVEDNDVIREKFPKIKTQQIIYGIYENELVRISVQGASLGSNSKSPDVFDFYSYIASFKSNGENEHFYEYHTILKSIQEKGKLGPYYCMDYKRGEKMNEEEMKIVEEKMTVAYDFCNSMDSYYKERQQSSISNKEQSSENVIQLEEQESDDETSNEINVEDIPF